MPNAKDIAGIAVWIAAISSLAAVALLVAASFNIWMEGANLHPTPRINAFTVGLGFVPVPVLAWIVYLWTRTRPTRSLDLIFRIVLSCALLVAAYYCVGLAFFAAFFVG